MSGSPKLTKHRICHICSSIKTRKHITAVLKPMLFLAIFGMLALGVCDILSVPQMNINEKTGMRDIHKYPQSYDVCVIGRSTAVCNISCQELYEKYGIAGVSAAVSSQSFPMTLYTLEEVLRYQLPKVVILDTRNLFESLSVQYLRFQDESNLHYTLDDIQTFSIKKKVVEKARSVNEELDPWDYYSKFYYSHGNWKNISEKNFLLYDSGSVGAMHGNTAYLLNIAESVPDIYASGSPYAAMTIPRKMEQYIADAVDLCGQNGAELMLATCYVNMTKSQHNALLRLANKYHIKYLDINEYRLKTGFDNNMDLYDPIHFNLSGAIKMTDLLGEYLRDNYDFADRRKDPAYQRYENEKTAFREQKAFLFAKQSLLSGYTFFKYLTALNQLDSGENIIFISVSGDAMKNLSSKEAELLRKLGLKTDLKTKTGSSYAAVISKEGIWEEVSFLNATSLEGKIGTLSYAVISEGSNNDQRASICVNGADAISSGTGFNFVVYNLSQNAVVSSAFFDTTKFVNPAQSRYEGNSKVNLQYETAPNVWENAK